MPKNTGESSRRGGAPVLPDGEEATRYCLAKWVSGPHNGTYTFNVRLDWVTDYDPDSDESHLVEWRNPPKRRLVGPCMMVLFWTWAVSSLWYCYRIVLTCVVDANISVVPLQPIWTYLSGEWRRRKGHLPLLVAAASDSSQHHLKHMVIIKHSISKGI